MSAPKKKVFCANFDGEAKTKQLFLHEIENGPENTKIKQKCATDVRT